MKNKFSTKKDILKFASFILRQEAQAIISSSRGLNATFAKAVLKLRETKGKIIVIGIGKSGIIGRKIAATLSSTGSPSIFLHPVECMHGDLGIINQNDAIVVLSYSGETEETNKIIPFLKSKGIPIISITKSLRSKLAKNSTIAVRLAVEKEACPYNVVPTSSTTAMLALGDALAVTLMQLKGFTNENFAAYHPAGSIGRILTLKVSNLMRKGKDNPVINQNKMLKEALYIMTRTKSGAVSAVNEKGELVGYFTDGDLRRCFHKGKTDLKKPLKKYMTQNPITIYPDALAKEAARLIKEKKIDNIPVIDPASKKPVGIIDERDLIEKGFI